MGKPILLGVRGESRQIIEGFGAGVCFEPENESDFIEKLDALALNSQLYSRCVKGCFNLAKAFDRKLLAAKMLQVIKNL